MVYATVRAMTLRLACHSFVPGILGNLAAVTLLIASTHCLAQSDADISSAREIAKEGLIAFDAGRYEEANDKLSRALEVVGVPTLALYTARANVKLGHWVRASELYLFATRLDTSGTTQSIQLDAKRDAEFERSELLAKIPRLTVALEGQSLEGVVVRLDGHPVPAALLGTSQLVDPGQHVVEATRGEEVVKSNVTIAERDHKTTTLTFKSISSGGLATGTATAVTQSGDVSATEKPKNARPTEPPAPERASASTQRTVGWMTLGVGAAGLALGAGTGIWLLSERSRMNDAGCSGSSCYADQKSDTERYNTLRPLSTVGFIAGGVLTAVGVTLILSTPRREARTALAMQMNPGFMSVKGSF